MHRRIRKLSSLSKVESRYFSEKEIKSISEKDIKCDAGCKENRKVEKHGLKSLQSPKQVKELSAFEKELIAVVKDIKFRNTRSDFQTTFQEDIKLIHNSKKTMTFADKYSNM